MHADRRYGDFLVLRDTSKPLRFCRLVFTVGAYHCLYSFIP